MPFWFSRVLLLPVRLEKIPSIRRLLFASLCGVGRLAQRLPVALRLASGCSMVRSENWEAPTPPTTSQSSPRKPHTLVWRASARLRWDNFGRACTTASAGTAYVSSLLRSIPGRLVAGPSSRLLENTNTEVDSRVGALRLYVCRHVNRHTLATPMRRPLPVAEGIRLALRLDTLAPKMTRPKHWCRLASLARCGGSR